MEAADRSPSAALPVAIVELEVSGVTRRSCVGLVEEALVGVRRAVVDLASGRGSGPFEPGTAPVGELCAAVKGAGYTAEPFISHDRTS